MASSLKTARIWMIKTRKVLIALAIWIGVFICLRFGGFSERQSISLILLFNVYIAAEIANKSKNTPPQIKPLVIEVWPNVKPLLIDKGLLDEAKWNTVTGNGVSEGNVDKEGRKTWSSSFPLVFTMLKPSLYYSHNHRSFATKLKDVIDLRSVCLDTTSHGFFGVPAFYLREKRNSGADVPELIEILEFGLMVSGDRGLKESPLASLPKAIVDRAGVTTNLGPTLHASGWERKWIGGDDPDVEEEDVVEVLTHQYVTIHIQQV